MNFKMWLEGLEEYEPYKKNVGDFCLHSGNRRKNMSKS